MIANTPAVIQAAIKMRIWPSVEDRQPRQDIVAGWSNVMDVMEMPELPKRKAKKAL
jgi:hypothetical protein